jgi:DNA (cytosine-5)-methyltransferase 1
MGIPVIDLFAGPGGLGEGFSSLACDDGSPAFKIKLSIEKDENAHRTLELRAFLREFPRGEAPEHYYNYLAGQITREELFDSFPSAATRARAEAWLAELGAPTITHDAVDARIRAALGHRANWVLIGGPPCQAYSLVGRSRLIGLGKHGRTASGAEPLDTRHLHEAKRRKYDADPRHTLYRHYLRILAVHRPPVFVMENVKGLLSAKRADEHIFDRIVGDLARPSAALPELRARDVKYDLVPLELRGLGLEGARDPFEFVVYSEAHGIPQARHRIIILGVRSDIRREPGILPRAEPMSVAEAIADLPRVRSGLSKEEDSPERWRNAIATIEDASWMRSNATADDLRRALLTGIRKLTADLNRGGEFVTRSAKPARHGDWFCDPRLNGVCNHETRSHIRSDLHRYFFSAVFAAMRHRSPLLEDFPQDLLPKHGNVAEALRETKFNDRFRVQLAGRPSTTIVSHIAKDGHYYIHYDPTQCRSLTVREAARLQTFPDNYRFEGPRTEQYKQVGNAVPPLLALQIAEIVATLLRRD